ncbi:MAG: hypothetical protein ABH832_01430 [bacterium]
MSEKKSFFSALSPKSALLVGIVAGFLSLCTIGFIVLGVLMFKSNKTTNAGLSSTSTPVTTTQTNTNQTPVVVTKATKPVVELFIMSYCPYGLQMQKAYLPVMNLLKDKADITVKWVDYIMHGKDEIDENDRQYCIQKEQSSNYIAYATCFATSGDSSACLKTAKIDETKMSACIKATDTQYKTTENYNDQSTWLSGKYPLYGINADLNNKYGVQGSPTLVINGTVASGVSRTAESIKQAVCDSFETKPTECDTILSSASASAGFGSGTGADTTGVECES